MQPFGHGFYLPYSGRASISGICRERRRIWRARLGRNDGKAARVLMIPAVFSMRIMKFIAAVSADRMMNAIRYVQFEYEDQQRHGEAGFSILGTMSLPTPALIR